jgi:hypothetical protein
MQIITFDNALFAIVIAAVIKADSRLVSAPPLSQGIVSQWNRKAWLIVARRTTGRLDAADGVRLSVCAS